MHVCMQKEEAHINMYSICFAHRVCMYVYILCRTLNKLAIYVHFVFSLPSTYTVCKHNICMYMYLYYAFVVKRIATNSFIRIY
jgi:hypothetical protein